MRLEKEKLIRSFTDAENTNKSIVVLPRSTIGKDIAGDKIILRVRAVVLVGVSKLGSLTREREKLGL